MSFLDPQHIEELQTRREKLSAGLQGSVLLIASAYEKVRNNDVPHAFRQSSDFAYLTGFPETDSLALIDSTKQGKAHFELYVRERNKSKEIWDGKRFGADGAKEDFFCDEAYVLEDLEEQLQAKIAGRDVVLWVEKGHPLQERLELIVEKYATSKNGQFLRKHLDGLRICKSAWEVAQIEKAVAISIEAHHNLMKAAPKAAYEYELEAELDYACRRLGAKHQAYGAIVGAGENACCLHYVFNDAPIDQKDLVLVDAGAEFNHYAADITRTFPASGQFSAIQKKLYQIVLDVQKKTIDLVRPGISLMEIHRQTSLMLAEGLIAIGYFEGSPAQVVDQKLLFAVYPHGTGHQLGLDVHDVTLGRDEPLEEGMVITIEPGLYFQPDDESFPLEARGIGIRIEDNILVTKDGHRNLTSACLKEVADLEALIQG